MTVIVCAYVFVRVCVLNRISGLESGWMDGSTYSNSGVMLDWTGAYPGIHWTDDKKTLSMSDSVIDPCM